VLAAFLAIQTKHVLFLSGHIIGEDVKQGLKSPENQQIKEVFYESDRKDGEAL